MNKKLVIWLVVALIVGGVIGYGVGSSGLLFGVSADTTTVSNPWVFAGSVTHSGAVTISGATVHTGTVKIGSNGSTITELKATTCDMYVGGGATVGATSTVTRNCTVTGINTGDVAFASFATTTVGGGGWAIMGATAMNGSVDVQVINLTGAAAVIPAALASSTQIFYVDN